MEQLDDNGMPTNRTIAVSCKVVTATQEATITGINGTRVLEANVTEFSPSLETDFPLDPQKSRWSSMKDTMPDLY